jgi:V/A-type H+-transporting ATPase subunit I
VSLIEPVFKIIEVVPGYNELDISLWFLIFFSIFFGMLIGDAGYGLIFLGLTFAAQKKWGRRVKDQSPFILFYLLSTFAIVWGVLTVTFFGQEWIPPSVKPLFPALRDSRNIQAFCFFLGALQLSVAHAWRALIKLPSVKALSDAGVLSREDTHPGRPLPRIRHVVLYGGAASRGALYQSTEECPEGYRRGVRQPSP